jgi:hypothetical protein
MEQSSAVTTASAATTKMNGERILMHVVVILNGMRYLKGRIEGVENRGVRLL